MVEDLFSFAGSGIENMATGGNKLEPYEGLQFYGLFKQAISGDAPEECKEESEKALAKHRHWAQHKGMTKTRAKIEYACLYCSLSKEAEDDLKRVVNGEVKSEAQKNHHGGMGPPVVSTPVQDQETREEYLKTLSSNKTSDHSEVEVFQIYEDVRSTGEWQKLLELPTDT